MPDFKIGFHDRGLFDNPDDLLVKGNTLRKFKTATEATNFAKLRPGSEVIIKNQDDTYSVYNLETSETGKKILNNDFKNDNIKLTSDVAKIFGGEKAYVSTDDNVIRSLEIAGIELESIDQEFVKANLNLVIEDKDGIDTNSKKDIEGTISGDILIKKEAIEYSLAQANTQLGGVLLKLSTNPNSQKYGINISFQGIDLGKITLKMEQGGIKAKIETAGIVGNGLNYTSKILTLGYLDIEELGADIIKKYLSNDLGLKVLNVSKNEFKLEPDFKNNKIFQQISVADMKINLEEVKTDSEKTSFKIDNSGDLNINIQNGKVIASSNSDAPLMKNSDKEGSDQINVSVSGILYNDFSSEVHSSFGLKINVTKEEKDNLKSRIKFFSGKEIDAYGKLEISDIKVDTKINPNGKIEIESKNNDLKVKSLDVQVNDSKIKLEPTTGNFDVEEKDKKIFINAKSVNIVGSIDNSYNKLSFKKLNLNGNLIYDPQKPDKLVLEGDKNSRVQLSLDIFNKIDKSKISIKNLDVKGADVNIDFTKGDIKITQGKDATSVSLNGLKLSEDIDLKNIIFKGDFSINTNTGVISLQGKNIGFSGKIRDINIQDLRGVGNLLYDPENGIKIENTNLTAKGKVGDFDISKIKVKGDIVFDKNGDLLFSNVSDVELNSDIGLKVKGDIKVKYNDGFYTFNTTSSNPISINYEPKSGSKVNVSDLVIQGNVVFNEKKSTFSFNDVNNNLKISQGNIAGVNFNDFNITGEFKYNEDGTFIFNNSKGKLVISGNIDKFNIKSLTSTGDIKIDPNNKSISWDKEISLDLPDKKLKMSSYGNVNLNINEKEEICITTNNGVLNATIGETVFKDFKLDGRVVYNPATGNIRFEGIDQKDLRVSGSINGKTIELSTTGGINFSEKDGYFSLSGENIKINGIIDGFKLESVGDTSGKVMISNDMKQVDVSELRFNFKVDGINVSNREGGIRRTSDGGYELSLCGNFDTEKDKVIQFLEKVSNNSLTSEDTKKIIADINKNIQDFLSRGEIKNGQYEDLIIRFDKNFTPSSFEVKTKGSITNTKFNIEIGKEKKTINMGTIDLSINISSNNDGLRIKDGNILFDLNQDLRETIKNEVTKSLENVGLKDIDLEVLKNGEVKIKNATYEVFSSPLDKLGRKIQKFNIPIISDVVGRVLRITDISADLKISTKIEDKKLIVSIDKTSINQLLGFIVTEITEKTKITNLTGEVADKTVKEIEDLKINHKTGENVFAIDLQELVSQNISKDVKLKDITINSEGRVNINFEYNTK